MEIYVLIIFVVLVGLMVSSRMTAMEKRMKQQNTLNQIANQLGIPEPPVLDHVKQRWPTGGILKRLKL